jgi:glycosyltransferase involved in cell wall biosynthesis
VPKPTVTLLIPVLNEARPLRAILPRIDPAWVDQILFVDGNSTDDTVAVIREWGRGEVFVQNLPGLSNAYWESFPRVTSEVILTFSPDGNSLPDAIPALCEKIAEGYDMVIASRYLPGAGSDDDDFMTSIGNWGFTTVINLLFGARFTDSLVMLRAYRRSLIEDLRMDNRDLAFEPQLAIRCAVHGKKTCDIPAREPKRIGGERKMRVFGNGMAILRLIGREFLRKLRH